MAIRKYEDLNQIQLDVLKEIGNIGSGNAATALAGLLNKMIDIDVPDVRLMGFQEAIDFAGGPETTIVGILVRLCDDLEGMIMFLLEEPFAKTIIEGFFGEKEGFCLEKLDECDISTLSEIGNIMAASYVNAIASLTGMTIDVSVPSLCVDMLGAIMSVPAIEYSHLGEKVLLINEKFTIDDMKIRSNMMLIPTVESLQNLLQRLGAANE